MKNGTGMLLANKSYHILGILGDKCLLVFCG
jgi:hypothetical protein